jgi:hypothetical protein
MKNNNSNFMRRIYEKEVYYHTIDVVLMTIISSIAILLMMIYNIHVFSTILNM